MCLLLEWVPHWCTGKRKHPRAVTQSRPQAQACSAQPSTSQRAAQERKLSEGDVRRDRKVGTAGETCGSA